MPVKLRQWHVARAPQAFFEALIAVRHENGHLKALSSYYDNTISDPFPSRSEVYKLYDQIMAAQKRYIEARDKLQVVSTELNYYEDPDAMTWITRPDRRKYGYEEDEEEKQEEKKEESINGLGLNLLRLSELTSDTKLQCSDNDQSPSSPPCGDTVSDVSSPSTISLTNSPPSSPLLPLIFSPEPVVKKVRFKPTSIYRTPKKGIMRIRTREEVEAEFRAANKVKARKPEEHSSAGKRKVRDGEWAVIKRPEKKVKSGHVWTWPEAYFEWV